MPPKDHAAPITDADRAARIAFREYALGLGNAADVAARHVIDTRTAQRIFSGKRDVPPRLAVEIADRASTPAEIAAPLRAWAKERGHG